MVLFAVLLAGLVMLWRQNRAAQENIARLSGQLDAAQKDLQREREFFQMVTSPGSKVMDLVGTKEATAANGKLVYDKTGHAMLVASNLPSVPQGKEYQLWFIVSGKAPMPGKSFAPDSSGKGMMTDQMPEIARDSAAFAITLEPAGGVNSPTGAIYLSTNLPSTQ